MYFAKPEAKEEGKRCPEGGSEEERENYGRGGGSSTIRRGLRVIGLVGVGPAFSAQATGREATADCA